MKVELKKLEVKDMEVLWQKGFSQPNPEWSQWDGPYFDNYRQFIEFQDFVASPTYEFLVSDQCLGIFVDGLPIGMVSRYWENQATRWLEVGIIIYDEQYWSTGIGSCALSDWFTRTFNTFPEIEHLGLSTWSGNIRMMKAAEKIGLIKEAQIRKVRYWQDVYYDAVKYGVLREEWQQMKRDSHEDSHC